MNQANLASLDGPDLEHDHDALGIPEQLLIFLTIVLIISNISNKRL